MPHELRLRPRKKRLLIKLGGDCNLQCKHCHCATQKRFELNRDLFPWIKHMGFTDIMFSGGEPMLFFDAIKEIVNALPSNIRYNTVTNGTLLNRDAVEFFNNHDFRVAVSYDGENSGRDRSQAIGWHELAQIRNHGIATLLTPENADLDSLCADIQAQRQKCGMPASESISLNFVHQTRNAPNSDINGDLVKEYCRFMGGQLELDFRRFAQKSPLSKNALHNVWTSYVRRRSGRGVRCFNERSYNVALNGDFMMCSYDPETFGNIYDGPNWDKVESRIPERCKACPIWQSCRNSCIANITENECYIARTLYRHCQRLMEKYGVSYDDLKEFFDR